VAICRGSIEGQRLHFGARLAKLDMQFPQRVGIYDRNLRSERPGRTHPRFQFKQITAVTEDRPFFSRR
jgi:hypothetical protein